METEERGRGKVAITYSITYSVYKLGRKLTTARTGECKFCTEAN